MNSQLVVFALVLLSGALSVNGSAFATYIKTKADQSLLNALMESRVGSSDQIQCFQHYNPKMNECGAKFEEDYFDCKKEATVLTDALIELGTESRNNITSSSNAVCSEFEQCQLKADNLAFFDCHSNLGGPSVRQVYVNSQNASVSAAELREGQRKIEVDRKVCENKTEAAYVEKIAELTSELQECLNGGINWTDAPATEAPATEAPATEAPTTEAPATEAPTTEAPATEAPTTEAPATEAPATEAPATEAPATEAPATEAPTTEAPATEAPATEAPATEAPATEAPATEAPATEAPATEAPATEAPATEAPATEAPATEAPATEAPATEAPATEAPATEAPATTEADQVEELRQNNAHRRLQQLVSSWRKRFA